MGRNLRVRTWSVDNLLDAQHILVVEEFENFDLAERCQRKLQHSTAHIIPMNHVSLLIVMVGQDLRTPSCSRFNSTFFSATISLVSRSRYLYTSLHHTSRLQNVKGHGVNQRVCLSDLIA